MKQKWTKENPDPNGFYPGWAEDGGKAQALIDRAEGETRGYTRTPEQRERMAAAQRLRWRKVREIRASRMQDKE